MTLLPDLDESGRRAVRAAACDLTPIGYVRSPHRGPDTTPIQTLRNPTEEGCLAIFPEFTDGLDGLAGFDYAWVLSWLDQVPASDEQQLRVVPFLLRDRGELVGVFATRYPQRPNPLGLSLIRILAVEAGEVRFAGVDLCHGTPVLDIKPWERHLDIPSDHERARGGWYEHTSAASRHQILPDP